MTIRSKVILALTSAILLSLPVSAQVRDPLSPQESDMLREAAQDPLKRLKLLIKFAAQRLDTLEQIKQSPTAERGTRMHDVLVDFRDIIDELDDNIDDYSQKKADLRKPLNEVVEAESGFDMRLKTIKEWSQDPKHTVDYKAYSFVLDDAMEAVSLSLEDAKQTLEEQNTAYAKAKKKD